MRALLVALLALSSAAQADLVLGAGVGKNIWKQNGTPFERAGILGYQLELPKSLFVRPQVGYFLDPAGGEQRSSYWAAALIGFEASSSIGIDLHFGMGPAYLQNPDRILGGHFQFNLELGGGVTDENVKIKLALVHLSSAGINMPNLGRDLIPCLFFHLRFL